MSKPTKADRAEIEKVMGEDVEFVDPVARVTRAGSVRKALGIGQLVEVECGYRTFVERAERLTVIEDEDEDRFCSYCGDPVDEDEVVCAACARGEH